MIHQYKMNGYNIVLDVNSGCVHTVDDVAYDIIELYENMPAAELIKVITARHGITADEVREVIDDLEALKKEKKLYTEDIFAGQADLFKKRQSVVKALCLHVAHACNMTCGYCFAGKGEYHGEKALMSYDVGKRALDWLIENSGSRQNLEVDFFGGEPLLNFEVVKQLVAYGRSREKECGKKFRFTLTTNGILLNDEVIEFAKKEMSNVVISLDGRKEVNDKMRRTLDLGGTYEAILPAFKKLAQSRDQKDYYVRGTYTHYNTDFASDILHMADLGFKELSIEPVVAPPDAPYALTESDLPKLLSEYERLACEMLERKREGKGRDFTFYHYMIDLTGGPCIVKRISGCGVGTEYMAVTPSGDFYPCHQFVGDEKFLLGNIYDGITNGAVCEEFQGCNVYSHDECKDCFAKLYCSGGCAANAYHTTGSITGVYEMGCELHKKRIECAIMLKVAEMCEEL
ncbi:thioether cross-link-forming SCIFF peptide maturase [Anaerovorax odorimutans]|uniref:Thioether cross-link-forming SCIFF peptide maturase n=1 Tax=Anaerovorax odorimutans TaxID=109327 RepID=A0ABT1RM16_9FIRM|nr:thioether cross-link-forming SCIFF peptide maturase [Anaerovorax odorimutans]MCQ4635981.1 thioether cross-link-forming SCIFF peptide maturase [Anaerovorax odorimutans]